MYWLSSRVFVLVLLTLLFPPHPSLAATETHTEATSRREFFGIVGRDPWYTLDVNGDIVADEPPVEFLDHMAADLARLGTTWVRIEFHAEITDPSGPGFIAYQKYDRFIREIAPRHGLKVLALLNSGIVSDTDPLYAIERLEDPPDRAGVDPNDLSNNYTRVFVQRAREIAARYGDAIAAYEIFNEPNINVQLHLRTGGARQELNAERFATLMTNTYMAIKQTQPMASVIMAGLLHGAPVEKPGRIPSDYLAEVYTAPRVEWYRATRPLGIANSVPWDAVALHPYDLTPADVETHLREVKARMYALGDPTTRIWVTEIGRQAEPPPVTSAWTMPASPQEIEQAQFMQQVFTRLMAMPDIVERVFWFKYEDFRENDLPRNWGLVRLLENGSGQYDASVVAYPRKPAYSVFQQFANPEAMPTAPRPPSRNPGAASRYFPETGQEVSGPFLRFWEQHGGLARFGLPKTTTFEQGGFIVQYFERARLEYHPEFAGSPYEIQLGHLGRQLMTIELRASLPSPPSPTSRYFPETGHYLSNGFKAYWEQNGGLAIYGLPITDEFPERNPADGKIYAVQYFERARFEYHPEHKGTPFEVQLGLLGNQVLANANWYR